MSWTEERVTELCRLWDAGYSASAIGRQIGLSKNAIIGKAHRLGLKPRPSPIRRRIPTPTMTSPILRPEPQSEPAPMPMPPAPKERAGGPSCHWPIGDPSESDFRFCGKPAIPGKPYCSDHCAKAYISRSRNDSEAA
ncbi:MAG: GcrA family cell cycle regulator [Kiloniellales bacterium]|nr:GcrA family cell cycle regulator [Kiloniellales bacterium]